MGREGLTLRIDCTKLEKRAIPIRGRRPRIHQGEDPPADAQV